MSITKEQALHLMSEAKQPWKKALSKLRRELWRYAIRNQSVEIEEILTNNPPPNQITPEEFKKLDPVGYDLIYGINESFEDLLNHPAVLECLSKTDSEQE